VKFGGFDEFHAAFLNESRTSGRILVPRTENPGISLVFREMWDSTAVNPSFPVSNSIEETGRVPQVRQGVPGPKKTGEAHDRFGAID